MSNGSTGNTSGATVVVFDFARKSGSDQVPDNVFAELIRRLVGTLDTSESGRTVYQPTEPQDHTLVWVQTDPVTNIPVGASKIWSESQNQWVDSFTQTTPYVAPRETTAEIDVVAGFGSRTFPIVDMGRDDYSVQIEVTTKVGGIWQGAPSAAELAAAAAAPFSVFITNKSATSITFKTYGVPVDGLRLRFHIRNPEN